MTPVIHVRKGSALTEASAEEFCALALEGSVYATSGPEHGLSLDELAQLATRFDKDKQAVVTAAREMLDAVQLARSNGRLRLLPGDWRFTAFQNGFFTPERRAQESLDIVVRILRDRTTMTRDEIAATAQPPLWQTTPQRLSLAMEILYLSSWVRLDRDGQMYLAGEHLTGPLPQQLLASVSPQPRDSGLDELFDLVHDVVQGRPKPPPAAPSQSGAASHPMTTTVPGEDSKMAAEVTPEQKRVFIIHGRNMAARDAVEEFLKSLHLDVIDFDKLASGMGTEFVGNIVLEGLKQAHGIVALFTPDELSALAPHLRGEHEKTEDLKRWQARPNVIFEAGIAFGTARSRTILVTMGAEVSLFSDVGGIHLLHLNNSIESRKKFRKKLIGIKCAVDLEADTWTTKGDFDACVKPLPGVSTRDPFLK